MMLKPIETTVEDLAKPQPFLVLSRGWWWQFPIASAGILAESA